MEQMPDGPERDRAIEDIGDMIHLLDDAVLASRAGAGELAGERCWSSRKSSPRK